MCGRFEQHLDAMHGWTETLAAWPKLARFDIKPTQQAATLDAEGWRDRSWWLIPPWSKEPRIRYPTFNARAETLREKPSFRHAWKQSQRCIVPASCYFEWTGPKGAKQCHAIERADGAPHLLAGLWETWKGESETVESFTIVTVPAAPSIEWLHPRMPLPLQDAQAVDVWLHGAPEEAAAVLEPAALDYRATAVASPKRGAGSS